MRELASDYWLHFQRQSIVLEDDALYSIPTGSGETLVALAMAFPQSRFKPEYNLNMSTAFQVHAPLNTLVDALTHK